MQPLPDMLNEPVSMGTTLVAIQCKDGVVLAADSRTTAGSYIVNRVSNKITQITDYIYCCRSGAASDSEIFAEAVSYQLDLYEREMGQQATVRTAANVLRGLCYEYRDRIQASLICAGWDPQGGGQVYSVARGGSLVQQQMALSGSGSVYIMGYMDSQYKPDMTKEECAELCLRAIALAMKRDAASGGVCRLVIITKDRVEKRTIPNDQLPQF
ncbi:proteasome subunit beta type-6-like [Tropilaelaps mercedesae]|uniref:Proteasome subunit beta n=1 Tax=Tropilaelaps mercedesae TaxID=418985 RepID=A0A1V9X621_9ACAR|nr:proteasome subunit beta type-6-like [Tropilaelaps mercedesae]